MVLSIRSAVSRGVPNNVKRGMRGMGPGGEGVSRRGNGT